MTASPVLSILINRGYQKVSLKISTALRCALKVVATWKFRTECSFPKVQMYHRCFVMPILRTNLPVCHLNAPAFFVFAAFLLQGKKGRCDMKITVYYEDKYHPTILDVPDADCEIWIEDDYRRRLSTATDKSSVTRRKAQEIMDEDYNKPTFNSNQRETRRHVSINALDPEDKHLSDGSDILQELIKHEGYEELHEAISKLQPQQQELLYQIFWEGIKQKDIAARDGVSDRAITGRMKKIYAALKKFLK